MFGVSRVLGVTLVTPGGCDCRLFDPPGGQPDYSDPALVGSPAHHKLSLDASRQAMTLLSNKNNALPLKPGGESRLPPAPCTFRCAFQ